MTAFFITNFKFKIYHKKNGSQKNIFELILVPVKIN